MSVGSKIKALRLQRGMTQNELADEKLTRSMLSRIESGSANPSIATLSLLADRLDVSPAFLLEEGEDLLPAERAHFSKILMQEYKAGNLRACLDLFSKYPFANENGFAEMYVHTAFDIAVQEFSLGHCRHTLTLLNTVEQMLPSLLLPIPSVSSDRIAFIRALINNIDTPEAMLDAVGEIPDFTFQPALFLFLLKLLRDGRHADCESLLSYCELDEIYRSFISAQAQIRAYKFIDALLTMKSLVAREKSPFFVKLFCYRAMENCCKLCEDYKGAYENHLQYQSLVETLRSQY